MRIGWIAIVVYGVAAAGWAGDSAPPTAGQTQPTPPLDPVFLETLPRIEAGYQERTPTRIVARNYVDMTYERYRLQCDLLTYDILNREILAEGNVILEEAGQRLAGETLHFNLATRRGVMTDVSGMAAPDLLFVAGSVAKCDERRYLSERGEFTSCTQPNPRWKISAVRSDLTLGDHLTLRHAVFKLKSVPVFYLPYMRYPISEEERSTGFLMPNYGYSQEKGRILGGAFFWAINRSQDATVGFRSYSNLGIGIDGEYRYIYSNSAAGSANVIYVFGKEAGKNAGRSGLDGYFLDLQHSQLLPFGFASQVDITILTSYAFKSVYGSGFENVSDPRKSSSLYVQKKKLRL